MRHFSVVLTLDAAHPANIETMTTMPLAAKV
jgi:hypothetical protein